MPPLSADRHRIERAVIDDSIAGMGRVSAAALWPGFDPAALALAVAFPRHPATWLINHDPVDGYDVDEQPSPRRQRRDGLDERIVANSVAMIAGRLTATIIVEDPTRVAHITALAAHELFHVHQAQRYPDWGANEAGQLAWPWDDADNLARSMHELALLRAATVAPDDETSVALARQALTARRDRFVHLPPDARAYEDAVELAEGTAHWIEHRTTTLPGTRLHEPEEVNTIDVRRRCYRTGRDWCILLDRLAGPNWVARLPTGSGQPTPVLSHQLEVAIGLPPAGPDERWRNGLPDATAKIAAERTRRQDRVAELRGSFGGSVVIQASAETPLRVTGLDPMNLTALADGQVLHERYVALTLGGTPITVLNHPTLTMSVVELPLFTGLDRAEILVDVGLITAIEKASPTALTTLGIRIDGPCVVRRAGPRTIHLMPGTQIVTGR